MVDSAATSNKVSAEEAEEGHTSWAGIARDLHVGDFHQVVRASISTTTTPGQLIADQQKKPASRSLPPGPVNTRRVLRGKRDEQGSIKGIYLGAYMHLSADWPKKLLKMISLVGSTTLASQVLLSVVKLFQKMDVYFSRPHFKCLVM